MNAAALGVMTVRQLVLLMGLCFVSFAPALAETHIVRPGKCAPRPAIVFVIREEKPSVFLQNGDDRVRDSVALFLRTHSRGWASRRLLARFDLILSPDRTTIVNAGPFCTEGD